MKAIHKKYINTIAGTWGVSLLLLILAYTVVIGPQGKSRINTSKFLAEQKLLYEEARKATRQEEKDALKEEVRELTNRVEDFVVAFEDSANLTFDISRIADEFHIESFNIKNQGNAGMVGTIESKYACENYIEISFRSDFIQFASLLNAIERHRPVLFVQNFSICPPDLDKGKPQISMNLVYLARKAKTN